MNHDNRPVLIMAGGTGGHVYPALAVARALLAKQIPVVWLGTHKGLEARVIPQANIPIEWLSVSGLRGKNILTLVFAPFRLLLACYQAAMVIARNQPRVVLGMGGFVAGPGGLVCKIMHTPLVIHEQNAIAGLTNNLLSKVANSILQAFPNTFKPRFNAYHSGNPVREDIAALPAPEVRMADRQGRLRVLVVGGSLGARFLNEILPLAVQTMPVAIWPDIRHQVGLKNIESVQQSYEALGIDANVTAFIEDMAEAYAWADLVICRAGAMTIAELAAAGLASILVPFPHAVDDHQTLNASYLADNGAAILAPQMDISPERLGDWLGELSIDRQRLIKMACQARGLAQPEATQNVVRECLVVARSYS